MRLRDIREQSIKTFFQFQSQPQRNSNRKIIQWNIFHRIDLLVTEQTLNGLYVFIGGGSLEVTYVVLFNAPRIF